MNAGPVRSRRVRVGTVGLHVVDGGTRQSPAPTLVVLHGFTGTAQSMEPLTSRLRHGHRVVAVDLIGHGDSDAPGDVGLYSPAAVASQVAGVVEALAAEPVVIVGYSMGGRVALTLACSHAVTVVGVVTIGASAGLGDPAERAARRAADERLAASLDADGVERFVDRWMDLPIFASQAELGAETRERIRADKLRNSARGLALSLRGTGTGSMVPLHDPLSRCGTPMLFVAGEQDHRYARIAAELAAVVPDGRSHVVAGAGHATHLEAPDETAAVIEEFLAGL